MQEAAERGWNGRETSQSAINRMVRLRDTASRYGANIERALNNANGGITNEQYDRQFSRRVYMGLSNG